jgi:hypothetical protein
MISGSERILTNLKNLVKFANFKTTGNEFSIFAAECAVRLNNNEKCTLHGAYIWYAYVATEA